MGGWNLVWALEENLKFKCLNNSAFKKKYSSVKAPRSNNFNVKEPESNNFNVKVPELN